MNLNVKYVRYEHSGGSYTNGNVFWFLGKKNVYYSETKVVMVLS